MVSFIDPSVPIFGSPTTESVRHNFLIAKQEIEALQGAVGITVPISIANGGTGATTTVDALRNLGALPLTGGTLTGPLILAGNPTNDLGAATKIYVDAYFPVSIANGGTGATNPTAARTNIGAAPLASPAFTGTPTAPTVPASNNSTILATTEFVHNAIATYASGPGGGVQSIAVGTGLVGGGQGMVTISLSVPVSVANGGTSATTAVQALSNLGGAPLVSPSLLGTPNSPNPPFLDNTTRIATTSWVNDAISHALGGGGGEIGVVSVTAGYGLSGGGTGAVTIALVVPISVSSGGTGATTAPQALVNLGAAPINSPNFTGVPTASTAAPGTNTSQIATTAYVTSAVQAAISGGGGPLTGVIAGEGLVGGGSTGVITLALAVPVSVADGGTGGGTPQAALFNLGAAPLNSPTFTGNPQAPTPPPGDNDATIPNTSWVKSEINTAIAGSVGGADVTVGATPPVTPSLGDMWWDTISGQLFVWYIDVDSSQWVIANSLPIVSAKYNLAFSYTGGLLATNQLIGVHKVSKAITIPANFGPYLGHNSEAGATANATVSTAITVQRALAATPNTFTQIGAITIGAGSVTPVFTTQAGADVSIAQGDVIRLVGPAVADATLANFYCTLVAQEA